MKDEGLTRKTAVEGMFSLENWTQKAESAGQTSGASRKKEIEGLAR